MTIKVLPKLYGRASTGKIKWWQIEAQCWPDGAAEMTTRYGYLGGAEQQTSKEVTGKNIGKSNETTPFEQAVLEATSLWKSKKDEGYVEDQNSIPKAKNVKLFLPMLAQVWEKRKKYIKMPAYGQPKLDGVRCLASMDEDGSVTMWSRGGKLLENLTEIEESLASVLEPGQCTDGEIYVHGWTFQEIVSAVKKRRESTTQLKYHIYDCPHPTLGFHERFVEELTGDLPDNLIKVQTTLLEELDETTEHLQLALDAGYEGLMVRNYNSTYKYKHRSNDLQKLKCFLDEEYRVIDVEEASGRDAGTAVFVCETEDGKRFNARPMGTREQRRDYFENFRDKYYGKLLTVRFQEFTDDGVPRFPVGVHFRPEWDK